MCVYYVYMRVLLCMCVMPKEGGAGRVSGLLDLCSYRLGLFQMGREIPSAHHQPEDPHSAKVFYVEIFEARFTFLTSPGIFPT